MAALLARRNLVGLCIAAALVATPLVALTVPNFGQDAPAASPSSATYLLATATRSSASPAKRVAQAAADKPNTRLFGVSVASLSQIPAMTDLSRTLHHPLDVIDMYSGWSSPFPSQGVGTIAAAGAIPEVTWEPWYNTLGVNQDTFPLSSIASGVFDSYIDRWAAAAASWKGPLLLRFGHEMNGTWYPWAVGVNGNTAQEYVAAYRHVHALFVAAGATNVYWIWSPNVVSGASSALSSMYPGSGMVNFIGVDGYNMGVGVPYGSWVTPKQLFSQTMTNIAGFARNKPILISETGSSEKGGSKAAWIGQLLSYLDTQPHVVGFVWSEYGGTPNWRIESSASSEDSMRLNLAAHWST